jgi:hypothetical protein
MFPEIGDRLCRSNLIFCKLLGVVKGLVEVESDPN